MTSSSIVLATFSLAFATAATACGGITLDVPSGPPHDDGGPVAPEDAGGEPPVGPDSGSPTPPPKDDGGSTMSDASAGAPCNSGADCGPGETCEWPVSEDYCIAFNPAGTCMPLGPLCNSIPQTGTGCGCDGVTVTWEYGCNGLPAGYTPQGIAHPGPCADAGVDASAPVACSSNDDCPSGEQCAYAVDAGCGATAECVPPSAFGLCNCEMEACGCNGTTEIISCCGSYASARIASTGQACAGADGGL
jgi:hypothetical protein